MKRTMLPAVLLTAVVLLAPALVWAGCGNSYVVGGAGGTGPATTIVAGVLGSTSTTVSSSSTSSTSSTSTTLGAPPTSVQATATTKATTTTAKPTTTTTDKATTTTKTTLGAPPSQPTTTFLQFTIPTLDLGPVATVDTWAWFEETDPHLQWNGPWDLWCSAKASQNGYRSAQSPASVLIRFTGQRINFQTMQDKRNGIAKLTLDGSEVHMVDLYGEAFSSQPAWASDQLSEGTHTLLIEWTGTKNPANIYTSNLIQFDYVLVYGGTLVDP
jgi:hypothetical protein